MEISIIHDFPPAPEGGGRALFEYQGVTGPLIAVTQIGDWTAGVRLDLRGGKWVASEFRMYPATHPNKFTWSESPADVPGERGLTSTLLRQARLAAMVDEAVRRLSPPTSSNPVEIEDWYYLLDDAGVRPSDLADDQHRTVGRPPLADVTLAELAVLYEKTVDTSPRNITKRIADRLGEPNPTVITDRVHKARERGFLTAAPAKGKAGGRATEKAHEVLRRAMENQKDRDR